MTDNVVKFRPRNATDHPDVLLAEMAGKFKDVMVIGWTTDGDFGAFMSGGFDETRDVLFALEILKAEIMAEVLDRAG